MTVREIEPAVACERLKGALAEFESLGFPRPLSRSHGDFALGLARCDVLDDGLATRFATAYADCRYAQRPIATATLDELLASIERSLAEFRSRPTDVATDLVARCATEIAPPAEATALTSANGGSVSLELVATDRASTTSPYVDVDEVRLGGLSTIGVPAATNAWRRRLSRPWPLAIAGVAWTAVMLTGGHLSHDRIASLFRPSAPPRPTVVAGENPFSRRRAELNRLRQEILESSPSPERTTRMLRMADDHVSRHDFAHAVVTFERVIDEEPTHAEALNGLAWLLLTAKDSWYQSPRRALSLAERAYAADPQPHVGDTLAEACFQNQQIERAVAIAESVRDAAAQDDRHRETLSHYETQLRKFRKSLPAATAADRP